MFNDSYLEHIDYFIKRCLINKVSKGYRLDIMCKQCEEFDTELKKNDFINHHYECLPFIGDNYKTSRLLLIGESHYVEECAIDNVKREDFYDISFDDLPGDMSDDGYKTYINTRYVFDSRINGERSFKGFFSGPATEIARIIYSGDTLSLEQRISAMHQYAFMNYFKRPSYDAGKTITGLTEADRKYAYEISCYIIKALSPKLIVFLSKKAYKEFYRSDQGHNFSSGYDIKRVCHPSSCWWNRIREKSDKRCARQDFHDYVEPLFK